MYIPNPEQSRTGLPWITESEAVGSSNFFKSPVGENEYKNPSNEPIDIQPYTQVNDTFRKKNNFEKNKIRNYYNHNHYAKK